MAAELSTSSSLDSIVESADLGEDLVRRFSEDAGFAEEDRYFIGLAVREVLVNAIRHGNRFDPAKKVGLQLTAADGALTIEVNDEGDGFLLDSVPDPHAHENRERRSGRGVALARAIMDEFRVEQNHPRGTRIRMTKSVTKSRR